VFAGTVIVIVETSLVSDGGEKEAQFADSETESRKPFTAVTVIVDVPEPPAVIVKVDGLAEMVKSGTTTDVK
jgi:hypothetical protein